MVQGKGWMRGEAAVKTSPAAGAGTWLVVVAGHTTTCKTKQKPQFKILSPPTTTQLLLSSLISRMCKKGCICICRISHANGCGDRGAEALAGL